MKLFFIIQIVVTLGGSLLLLEMAEQKGAASFACGSGLILLNVATLAFVWFQMIQKKLVAVSLTIIVFKYAILGVIIYKLLSFEWIQRGWFCVGLGSLVISTGVYAIFSSKKDEENG